MRRPPSHLAAALAVMVSLLTGWALTTTAVRPIRAAEASAPPSLLERSRADVAVLSGAGPDGTPRLLVVDPVGPGATTVRLAILERDSAWAQAGSWVVDLGAQGIGDLGEPWLVGLGGDRFALIARFAAGEYTAIVTLRIGAVAGNPTLAETGRRVLDAVIDDAGIADAFADGVPDLVIATSWAAHRAPACQGTTFWILGDGDLGRVTRSDLPGVTLRSGVLGSFDDVPGDDLVAYGEHDCPASRDPRLGLRLMGIRLADGSLSSDRLAAELERIPPWVGPPVRFDADGDGRHELLALVPRGLAILDPAHDWAAIRVATSAAFPLGAAADASRDGRRRPRVAWMEPSVDGRGSIGAEYVARRDDGSLDSGPATVMWDTDPPSDRWTLAVATQLAGAYRNAPPVAWSGGPADPGCPDLLVPTATLTCGSGELVAGAAWASTRPLLALGDPGRRRVLVAAAVDSGPGLPPAPSPWLGGPPGWWRHGPSVGFALAEVRAADIGTRRFVERPAIDRTATVGPAVVIGGRTGTRLFVSASTLADDAAEPRPEPGFASVLGVVSTRSGPLRVVRIGVPPGSPSGTERGSTLFPLAGIGVAGGAPASRWAMTAIFLDDLGETGLPVGGSVRRDVEGPFLAVTVPFASPPWPFEARLTGRVEPGASVTVDGHGPATVDARGRFAFDATLAPWPQTLRVVATDPVGNRTVQDVSAIGGLDYREFPWAAILAGAFLIAVVVSGVIGSRRRGVPTPSADLPPVWDAAAGPELEDLPPGGGIGAGR